jgi:hypothetical protein
VLRGGSQIPSGGGGPLARAATIGPAPAYQRIAIRCQCGTGDDPRGSLPGSRRQPVRPQRRTEPARHQSNDDANQLRLGARSGRRRRPLTPHVWSRRAHRRRDNYNDWGDQQGRRAEAPRCVGLCVELPQARRKLARRLHPPGHLIGKGLQALLLAAAAENSAYSSSRIAVHSASTFEPDGTRRPETLDDLTATAIFARYMKDWGPRRSSSGR